ncbi:MAG: PmoA family protein [Desulfobacterales bacterium]
MTCFSFETEGIALPQGAWAKTHRRSLCWQGKELLACTQGEFRPYLYPVFSPAGFMVTTESPADHPHHNSLWFGTDHLHVRMPVSGAHYEEYTYCFYVNQTFQGRSPGRILETAIEGTEKSSTHYGIVQTNEWRGPAEWAADNGRVVAKEIRSFDIKPGEQWHVIDIQSQLLPTEWDVTIGPTRHAYFNVRVSESMRVNRGGTLTDAEGHFGGNAITGSGSDWVDYSGPVSSKNTAGISIFPYPDSKGTWVAYDWGIFTANPFSTTQKLLRVGECLTLKYRLIVHDGDEKAVNISNLYDNFLNEIEFG